MSADPTKPGHGVAFASFMPHAPVLVPGVGHESLTPAAATVVGMKLAATRLNTTQPQAVVVISPHSPRRPGAFGVWTSSHLRGNFGQFGAPLVALDFSNDLALVAELQRQALLAGLQVWQIPPQPLDHGALVPLWYLADAGWHGPTVVLSLNYPDEAGLAEFGRAVAGAAAQLGRHVAVVASGDMSHRLTPNAPAGYEPRARDFDRQFIACLRRGAYRDLQQLDPQLRQAAGEDALDSALVAVAMVGWNATGHEVLSYEGPFGVGYGVAVLFDSTVRPAQF